MDLLQPTTATIGDASSQEEASAYELAPSVGGRSAKNDDGALMLRYRDGDMRAFEILYTRHKGALYRYLQRICRNREACNDLFQETWSKVVTNRQRYEVRAQFTTYLFHIAHNCAIDYFRRAERQHIGRTDDVSELQERLPSAETDRPDSQLSEAQLQAAFKQALQELPEEQRNVFVLREETGLTLEEIGALTGVTMETAKSRLRYALGKLRSALKQYRPHDSAPDHSPSDHSSSGPS
jgi:RNA polymerase sigma-70 factor (ECF subfamily)